MLIIFDEFGTTALMNERQQIDRERYPNFATLAQGSTWYRSATNEAHVHTESAVPAILTGQLPQEGLLPIASDHPRNIFTLFGGDYRLHVFESLTQALPALAVQEVRPARPRDRPRSRAGAQGGTKSLVSDVFRRLPAPSATEGPGASRLLRSAKRGATSAGSASKRARRSGGVASSAGRGICEFIRALRR